MDKQMKQRSLIVSNAIILSLLLVIIISVISILMYNSTQNEIFRKFTDVGEKLRDVSQANTGLISDSAKLINTGQEPNAENATILNRLLDGTIDDQLVANAYYFSAEYEENADTNEFTYLFTNKELRDIELDTGVVYTDNGAFSDTFKEAVEGKSALTDVFTDEYGYWISFLAPIKDDGGNVVAVYGIDFDYNGVKDRLNALILQTVFISIISIIVSILVIVFTLRYSLKPLIALVNSAEEAANGDLTVSVPFKINNEVGQSATAFNNMIAKLHDLVININDTSGRVTTSAAILTETAEEVRQGSEQIAATMEELASATESEANHATDLSNTMANFSVKIEVANENGRHIQASSNKVLEMTTEGYGLMNESTTQMDTINEIMRDAVEKVQGLDYQSQRISELVSVIQGIADQTNLLALNAAIEAARAGEQGQGFAVVANEVRKLAEDVSESVSDITGIVTGIQRETGIVTASLENGYKEVEKGTSQVIETGETFNRISASLDEMVDNIQTVTTNLAEINAESQDMNNSVQEIAGISEESAAGIEQTTASAEQSSTSMIEITSKSNDLTRLAEELNELVLQFKV